MMKTKTEKLDAILTHKLWGTLIFLFLMWFMFFCTFRLGAYPQQGIEWCMAQLADFLESRIGGGYIADFVNNGVIGGVGSVLSFMPNILILFFFTSLFESTGYVQRTAYLLDGLMHKIGLHGNSFIPLLMGFGCNVPAILATRNISDKNGKVLTVLMVPFMSCSAKVPIDLLLIGTFFPNHPITMLFLIYGIGIVVAILTALVLNKLVLRPQIDNSPVVLQPYKKPTAKFVLKLMWDASFEYLKKIGTVVLLAVMIIWFLDHFPEKNLPHYETEVAAISQNEELSVSCKDSLLQELDLEKVAYQQTHSYLGQIGTFVAPALAPLGFDWKMSICLVAGLPAKEFIVGTLGVLYKSEGDEYNTHLPQRLKDEKYLSGDKKGEPVFNPAVALSFLIFALLYIPCIATFFCIRKEIGRKWAIFSAVYSISIAWIMAFAFYHVALLFL